MAENNTEDNTEEIVEEEVIVLTSQQKRKKFLLEVVDLLKGAAFPFIIMCVFSSLIIMFTTYTDDFAVQLIATVGGEAFVIAALVMFGRSNGADAYKISVSNKVKLKINSTEEKVILGTGEYAVWKGFVIGFISAIPFIILQIIACTGEYEFVDFLLSYACGWAVAPFDIIGGIPQPYYFLMIILPIGLLGGFYIYGKFWEENRQRKIKRAEDDKRKGKKKHYYEENNYEKDRRYIVTTDKKNKKK